MKKIVILLVFLTTIILVSCDTQEPINCNDDQNLVDGVCQDIEPEEYDDRSLVTEECAQLDNIDNWQPVWCEEFNYEGLPDSNKWYFETGGSGWGNNELQYYTNQDLDNAHVDNGTLKITAKLESLMGNDYTSARITSKYRGDFLYGRFEIRAKLPSGKGTWPAIWMLPSQNEYGIWPASGEIDIMEHVGYDPTQIYATIHTGAYNHNLNTQIGYSKTVADAETAFHIYELVWEPGFMEVFVDGDSYGRFGFNPLSNVGIENSDAWPFDEEFYLILNLAVGGNWGGLQGIDDTVFPQTLEIDYIRVYQKDYAGMDNENPTQITNLSLLQSKPSSLQFMWTHATDDILIKEYEIFVDNEFYGITSLNSFTVDDLDPDTQHKIDIVSVDFAENKSEMVTTTFATSVLKTIEGRIEAEDYYNQSGVVRIDTTDIDGNKDVTWINVGDYMEYELYVPKAGTYKIKYRVASESNIGEIKLYGKTVVPLTTTTIPVSGSFDIWIDVESDTFNLIEGIYYFKVKSSQEGFNLNYFEFIFVE